MEPVRKLRIFVAMAARLLPGVRCSTLCTVHSTPSWRMVIPGRNCVARISVAPDAYGILRQAVRYRCDVQMRRRARQRYQVRDAAPELRIIDDQRANGLGTERDATRPT